MPRRGRGGLLHPTVARRFSSALVAALCALATTPAAQPSVGTLAVLDVFCCQAGGTPISAHPPEAGGPWRVDGVGAPPVVTSSRLNFLPGSAAVAALPGPAGDRTLRLSVLQPIGHAAAVTVYVFVRYAGPADYLAVRLRWPADDGAPSPPAASVTVQHIAGGAVAFQQTLGAVSNTRYGSVLVVVTQTGDALAVSARGLPLGTATVAALASATDLALAAEAPSHPNGGFHAAVEDFSVTVPDALPASVCPGLQGYAAQSCVRAAFAPLRTHPYDEARDLLFSRIWPTGSGTGPYTVVGLYGGAESVWSYTQPQTPRLQVQNDGFNTEHVWPRSRGAQINASTDGAPHNDLHHLAPAYGTFNSARSNRPFGDAFDQAYDTYKWLRGRTVRYHSDGPPTYPYLSSRVERDFLQAPDDGDGYTSLAELGRFDVRHALRGDVARMAAYFLTLYRIEAEDGDEGRAFIGATLAVLLDWHEQDPVSDAERERNERVYLAQGNRNPFVLDPTLLRRALYEGDGAPFPADVWINEIHHSNLGPDDGEGVEIAGPAGTDLYGYRVWIYSGSGTLYTVDGDRVGATHAVAFRGTIDDETGNLGAVWADAPRLRGGCQGLALTDPSGALVEFVSYGGCRFNALAGPVFDAADLLGAGAPAHPDSLVWSHAIRGPRPASGGPPRRVQEWSELPAGYSLQLAGVGRRRADLYWTGPLPATPGRLNDYQAPGARFPHPTSGWRAGDDTPFGLLAPIVDEDAVEDEPARSPERDSGETGRGVLLAVSLPSPNPARHRTRLAITASLDADLSVAVYDALGRYVCTHALPTVASVFDLDTSTLAAGFYLIRVTATLAGHAAQTVTRPLTVVR